MPKNLINSLFLKQAIENGYHQKDVKIITYKIDSVSSVKKPRSSLRHIYVRFKSTKFKNKELSMIAKLRYQSMAIEPWRDPDELVGEQLLYEKYLPKYKSKFSSSPCQTFLLCPNLIYTDDTPTDILILEDVTKWGFSPSMPELGCNLEESFIVVEKLAFFHAASAMDIHENPADYDIFNQQCFDRGNEHFKSFIINAFDLLLTYSEELEIDEDIIKKLEALQPIIWDKMVDCFYTKCDEIKVLNHGNLACTSIMFKYVTELHDVLFVNFQQSFIGSPVFDLMQFFASSVDYNVLINHRDKLIYRYHETFAAVLEKLEYPGHIPALHELANQINRRRFLDLVLLIIIGPYLRKSGNKIRNLINNMEFDNLINLYDLTLKRNSADIGDQLSILNLHGFLECDVLKEPESKVRKLMKFFENMI